MSAREDRNPITNQILSCLTQSNSKCAHVFDWTISTLIVLNVAAVVLESVQGLHDQFSFFFYSFEIASALVFAAEYILRVWASKYSREGQTRLQYVFSFHAIVDLLSFLPSLLPLFVTLDLRILRVLRLVRLLRLLKLQKLHRAADFLVEVLRTRAAELVMSFLFAFVILLLSSCLMYEIEREAQPDKFSSIPTTMWWAVNTLTTVGYGDVFPVTPLGKIVGGLISVLGVALFALPAGIIASGLMDAFKVHESHEHLPCENCGFTKESGRS